MPKIVGIYKITNPTGKSYIGQSVNCKGRFAQYKLCKCKDQPLLYNSFIKYGIENHKFEVIQECREEQLDGLEVYYMNFYRSSDRDFGLNIKSGGKKNCRHSEETKQKIREARNKQTPPMLGRKFSEEHKNTLSKINKGRQLNPEAFQKMLLANKGRLKRKPHSQETIEKIRQSKIGKPRSQETIAKIVATRERLRLENPGKKTYKPRQKIKV